MPAERQRCLSWRLLSFDCRRSGKEAVRACVRACVARSARWRCGCNVRICGHYASNEWSMGGQMSGFRDILIVPTRVRAAADAGLVAKRRR